ncbi:DUF1571 domain-containing protein [Planctomycetes bacterium Pan216]|uniref:DUF1571 domain-containing protein n=1 Tax=Kolteria novifilia TaxID=2527975 RepID=UPI0011A1D260
MRSSAIFTGILLASIALPGCSQTKQSRRSASRHRPAVATRPPQNPQPPQTPPIKVGEERPALVATEVTPLTMPSAKAAVAQEKKSPQTITTSEVNQPSVVTPVKSTEPTGPEWNLAQAKRVTARAVEFAQKHPKYTCRVTRQERVRGRLQPREVMVMNLRQEPRSVHFRWLNDENEGRQCVWVDGQREGQLIVLGGRGDFIFRGRRMTLDPNGIMARGRSRYSITESGMDIMIGRLQEKIDALDQGNETLGRVEYVGPASIKEWPNPLQQVNHLIPPGVEPGFDHGGVRKYYCDLETGQVVLVEAVDSGGKLVEYFRIDRFVENPTLSDEDFNPDQIWPETS